MNRILWKDGIFAMLRMARMAANEGDSQLAESLIVTATIATGEMDR